MGTRIESVYIEELDEYVDMAVIEEEKSVYVVNVDVKKYTESELIKMKRKHICDKYGVIYGKKMIKFEKVNDISDDELEIMCKFIASGHSKKDSLANARLRMKYELKL